MDRNLSTQLAAIATGVGVGVAIGWLLRAKIHHSLAKHLGNRSKEMAEHAFDEIMGAECKLVIVVRSDLKMGKGKACAQSSHAAVMAYEQIRNKKPILNLWRASVREPRALNSERINGQISCPPLPMTRICLIHKNLRKYNARDKAHNIIGIWPGTKRGTTADQIIIVGAHYDTVRSSPGVDDNGSGSAAVLEIAKLVAQNNCKLDKTLIFVLFDMEEDGLKGSKYFVKDYLIPIEVMENGAKVTAAIIMDMILEHDSTRNSQ
ncbi:unnamed protein product, partial [Medioppia subpectinata]